MHDVVYHIYTYRLTAGDYTAAAAGGAAETPPRYERKARAEDG